MKKQLDKVIHTLLAEGVAQGVFSGGSAGLLIDGKQVVAACGHTKKYGNKKAIKINTYFDLASLTKPLATTLLTFIYLEEGRLRLEDTLQLLGRNDMTRKKEQICIRDLLHHSSGMCAYRPFFRRFEPEKRNTGDKESLLELIVREPLEYQRDTESRYSDLGFILLGEIIQLVGGGDLATLFEKYIASPLCLEQEIFFSPIRQGVPRKECAATEHCGWRKRLIQGEVHDEHSWLMGEASGHAGLFATVNAVLTLGEEILTGWKNTGGSTLAIGGALYQYALKRQRKYSTWCLGFDTPSRLNSSSGNYLSRRSVGHLGYTGTSLWIDPEKELVIVLLTNRVHPDRENRAIQSFRPWFHDSLLEAAGFAV